MIRIRSKNVLLVAADTFSAEFLSNNKMLKHVSSVNIIFPTIHEIKPNVVIFEYDHLAKDMEKILRRMSTNPAYNRIKIYCYKNKAHTKTDSLLKALGVDAIFYPDDFKKPAESKNMPGVLSAIFEAPIINRLAKASN